MTSSDRDASPAKDIHRSIVLIVEDEILVRAAIAEYLRILGYEVVEAADAGEAVAVFASGEPVDVVLCDVDLPGGMDGISLARWISRRHSAPPVLLTSGRGLGCATGGNPDDFFIAKPYRLSELARRLRVILESSNRAGDDSQDDNI